MTLEQAQKISSQLKSMYKLVDELNTSLKELCPHDMLEYHDPHGFQCVVCGCDFMEESEIPESARIRYRTWEQQRGAK